MPDSCVKHDQHEYRISENTRLIGLARQERAELHRKDEEIENTINRWKWIGVGFGTCMTVFGAIMTASIGVLTWMVTNKTFLRTVLEMLEAKG